MLLTRQLLAGRELRRRGDRTRLEACRAYRRQAGGDSQEVAPPDTDGGETCCEDLQLAVADTRSTHERVSFYFSLGSSASLTPSPKNVNESIVIAIAIDGNTQRCQYERMYC